MYQTGCQKKILGAALDYVRGGKSQNFQSRNKIVTQSVNT